ncbi:hypothetical protein J6590_058216 [Homalodisca vitripennis]|nr:hypothetical protein J6590_058216 [Homalodisca vitripennis]
MGEFDCSLRKHIKTLGRSKIPHLFLVKPATKLNNDGRYMVSIVVGILGHTSSITVSYLSWSAVALRDVHSLGHPQEGTLDLLKLLYGGELEIELKSGRLKLPEIPHKGSTETGCSQTPGTPNYCMIIVRELEALSRCAAFHGQVNSITRVSLKFEDGALKSESVPNHYV